MAITVAVQTRIAEEIQKNLNLAAWLREALENELGASFGVKDGAPPKCGIDAKSVQKWRDVVKAMEALTVCKIKLDLNSKKMADEMSPEEEREAVKAYIRSLEPAVRSNFLFVEQQWHNSQK